MVWSGPRSVGLQNCEEKPIKHTYKYGHLYGFQIREQDVRTFCTHNATLSTLPECADLALQQSSLQSCRILASQKMVSHRCHRE